MSKIKLEFKKDVYLQNFDHYCNEIYPTFSVYFDTIDSWKRFLNALNESKRQDFLHLAAMYHFLVVKSDLKTNGEVVGYFDQSYKFICLISLIEAAVGNKYRDFFSWLNIKEHREIIFPLKWENLETRYKEYNSYLGAQSKFLKFFRELDEPTRERLVETATVEGNKFPLKELANYFYSLRSQFVHNATPVVQISDSIILSMTSEGVKKTNLTLDLLRTVFEHGFLIQYGFSFDDDRRE